VQIAGVTPRAFLRITQVTLVIVVLNIVTGAAVRLSDSGLGCPDWPTCSRHRFTPPLSLHPAIEFGNRMVVVVLCVFTAIALVAALRRVPRRRDLTWLAAGLLGGVIGEAVLGAVVVYTKLNPYAVMTHFMVGIVLLTDAFVLALLYLLDHTGAPSSVLERARLLLGTMVIQGGIGYTQYFTHLPAVLVGVHVFGATVVWMAMLWFYDSLTHRGADEPVAPHGPDEPRETADGAREVALDGAHAAVRDGTGTRPTPVAP
jgi:heme A synthase